MKGMIKRTRSESPCQYNPAFSPGWRMVEAREGIIRNLNVVVTFTSRIQLWKRACGTVSDELLGGKWLPRIVRLARPAPLADPQPTHSQTACLPCLSRHRLVCPVLFPAQQGYCLAACGVSALVRIISSTMAVCSSGLAIPRTRVASCWVWHSSSRDKRMGDAVAGCEDGVIYGCTMSLQADSDVPLHALPRPVA